MKALKEYIVNFAKLKPGKHEFRFTIDESFYKEFDYSLVKEGKVELVLTVEKQSETLLVLNFDFEGSIRLECDRCLDEFDYPVHSTRRLLLKLQEHGKDADNDELILLDADAYEIDLSEYIYEFINLELPLHKVCEDIGKQCNQTMTQYLGHVNSHEGEPDTDPRWSGLYKLKGQD